MMNEIVIVEFGRPMSTWKDPLGAFLFFFYLSENIMKKSAQITVDLVRRGTAAKQWTKEDDKKFFKRISHLSLHGRGIVEIGNLEMCTKLRVLFLYNNQIKKIENLSFAKNLTHLYLENNEISKMEGLYSLEHLKKLSLDGNRICRIEGLESCLELEELHVANQRLEKDSICLEFDEISLSAVSGTMTTLILTGSRVKSLSCLQTLHNLETLRAGNNWIENLEEVKDILTSCEHLNELELVGNPVSLTPNFRDDIVQFSQNLSILDGEHINPNQRAFLQAKTRRQQKSNSPSPTKTPFPFPFRKETMRTGPKPLKLKQTTSAIRPPRVTDQNFSDLLVTNNLITKPQF